MPLSCGHPGLAQIEQGGHPSITLRLQRSPQCRLQGQGRVPANTPAASPPGEVTSLTKIYPPTPLKTILKHPSPCWPPHLQLGPLTSQAISCLPRPSVGTPPAWSTGHLLERRYSARCRRFQSSPCQTKPSLLRRESLRPLRVSKPSPAPQPHCPPRAHFPDACDIYTV